ncbi:unnamed protein product, partial [Rotaria sp. Silwood1]
IGADNKQCPVCRRALNIIHQYGCPSATSNGQQFEDDHVSKKPAINDTYSTSSCKTESG